MTHASLITAGGDVVLYNISLYSIIYLQMKMVK